MKKISILLLIALLVFSCNDDDDIMPVCDVATNVSSNSITNNSAIITWESTSNSATYAVEYGVSGFSLGSGISISESNTNTQLTNLEANTSYDVYIQTVCGSNNSSAQTNVYSFVTIPVCDTVTNVSSNSITNNSAIITWETSNSSASYTLEYGVSGFTLGSGITVSELDTDAELINLEANTTYDIYIQTICGSNNLSTQTNAYNFTTLPPNVATEFKPTLSEMNLFVGSLEDLQITPYAFEYNLNSSLFTDYAHKQRIIALPEGTSMEFDGDGLPIFPDNTVIAKTFYYNTDERDLSLGRQIIETRILIKISGTWETGDYKWNSAQTEAVLDLAGSTLPITWIDEAGTSNSVTYKIPSNTDCFTCHHNEDDILPIGPKLRSMNFNINGVNQLEQFISNQQLTGVASSASVRSLPNWEDTSLPIGIRARAYMDINCAHCHIPGGQCEDESTLNFAFETQFEDTNIEDQTFLINYRITADVDGVRMPFIGTTILHTEGVQLIQDYLDTLD